MGQCSMNPAPEEESVKQLQTFERHQQFSCWYHPSVTFLVPIIGSLKVLTNTETKLEVTGGGGDKLVRDKQI